MDHTYITYSTLLNYIKLLMGHTCTDLLFVKCHWFAGVRCTCLGLPGPSEQILCLLQAEAR